MDIYDIFLDVHIESLDVLFTQKIEKEVLVEKWEGMNGKYRKEG